MNERQALIKTVILWKHIARHPKVSKVEAYRVLNLPRDLSDCPLCEYTRTEKNNYTCSNCPLLDFWPVPRHVIAPCCHDTSVYMDWTRHHQTHDALLIVDVARRKLKEITP